MTFMLVLAASAVTFLCSGSKKKVGTVETDLISLNNKSKLLFIKLFTMNIWLDLMFCEPMWFELYGLVV